MPRAVDFEKAVKAFGGFSQLARRLGEPLSTVHGWARRKRLPPWRAKQIELLAKAEKKDVFVKPKREARRKRAA